MSRTLASLLAVVTITAASASAQSNMPSPRPLTDGIHMDIVVHRVPLEYPYEARRNRLTGRGILFGQINVRTGFVTSVRMEKSTGYKILDDAALSAFRRWRFKPGTIRKFRTPITYTMLN